MYLVVAAVCPGVRVQLAWPLYVGNVDVRRIVLAFVRICVRVFRLLYEIFSGRLACCLCLWAHDAAVVEKGAVCKKKNVRGQVNTRQQGKQTGGFFVASY